MAAANGGAADADADADAAPEEEGAAAEVAAVARLSIERLVRLVEVGAMVSIIDMGRRQAGGGFPQFLLSNFFPAFLRRL